MAASGSASGHCLNCGTVLQGHWCHTCGQGARDTHRAAYHLVGEAFEDFFHLDGRVWRTLSRLVLSPGRLTRDYLDGQRVRQIPPLRLFLVTVFVVLLVGGYVSGRAPTQVRLEDGSKLEPAKIEAELKNSDLQVDLGFGRSEAATAWLRENAPLAIEHPGALMAAMREWAHRLAIVVLPISAVLLWLMFFWRRGVYLYDHFIFSMHSLSFQGFLLSGVVLAGHFVAAPFGVVMALSPVHLFVHMRGTYRTGVVGTLVRMAILFAGSLVAFTLLLIGLAVLGVTELHGA